MEFNTTQKTLFGHTNDAGSFFGESQSFTDGGGGDSAGSPFDLGAPGGGGGWCCCARVTDGPKCTPCNHCHSGEGERMGIHATKALCEAFGNIFQDTTLDDGTIVTQGTKCGGDRENPFEPVDASTTGGDEGDGGGSGGLTDFIPGTSHQISDTRVTSGGRPYSGLPHGGMGSGSQSTSSDPHNSYKCFYESKDDEIGRCVPCSPAEDAADSWGSQPLQDVFGNWIHCRSLEACRSYCDQHGDAGYRCILVLREVPVGPNMDSNWDEVPFCEQVWGEDIEYGTLTQCQQNCNGHDATQDAGWDCMMLNTVSADGKTAECVYVSSRPGRYNSEEECRQSCWTGAPPVI